MTKYYYLPLDEYDEAEKLLRESVNIYKDGGFEGWQNFESESLLGEAMLGQQKFNTAEKLLLAGHKGLELRFESIPPIHKDCLAESMGRFVKLYEAWDQTKPDQGYESKAVEWQRKLDEHQTKMLSESRR